MDAGVIADAISLDTLLDSEFWKKTRFYQPVDFLWQPTLFQPVGGMDQVQHSFAQQVAALGAHLHLNSPVKLIEWDRRKKEFVVHVSQVGTDECVEYRADYCFSNIAMPFLVQGSGVDGEDQPVFFIVGDQVSSLPGWQEGAIASALNAISRMARPDLQIQHLKMLPDTRLMVEGI